MAVAILPMVVAFVLLWQPPDGGATQGNLVWWIGIQIAFYLAFTAYVAPYLSLLPELTPPGPARTKLASAQGLANLLGLLVGPFLIGQMLHLGLPSAIKGLALVALPFLVAPLFVSVKASLRSIPLGRPFQGSPDAGASTPTPNGREDRPGLRASLAQTLKNQAFRIYIGSKFLFLTGMLALVSALVFLAQGPLGKDSAFATTLQGAALIAATLSIPLYAKLQLSWGGKRAYILSLVLFSLPAAAITLVSTPALALTFTAAAGLGVGGLFCVPYALLADIVEADRVKAGQGRECLYYGVQGLLLKGCYGVAPLLVVAVQRWFPKQGLGMIGPALGVMGLIAAWIFLRYPEEEIKRTITHSIPSIGVDIR